MRRFILATLFCVFGICGAIAQDIITFHGGEVVDGKVTEVTDNLVKYSYKGEDLVYTVGRGAIAQVKFASGRVQQMSEMIEIKSADDWEKVQILYDKADVQGLKRLGQVEKHSSGTWSFSTTAGHFAEKTLKKIRQEAAKQGAPFVLITSQQSQSGGMFADGHANMTGELYTYR